MPTITVRVDEELKERMDRHPEINWSEVTRQAITEKATGLERLERIESLASDSTASDEGVEEIAALVDDALARRYESDEIVDLYKAGRLDEDR